jgi:hypothetical protein
VSSIGHTVGALDTGRKSLGQAIEETTDTLEGAGDIGDETANETQELTLFNGIAL